VPALGTQITPLWPSIKFTSIYMLVVVAAANSFINFPRQINSQTLLLPGSVQVPTLVSVNSTADVK